MALVGKTNEEKMWNFLKLKGMNDYGASVMMGHAFAESGLNPKNLQNTGNTKLGMTDDEYVAAVDSGKYAKDEFVYDKQGFGLCQWTYWSRKKALYEFVKSKNKSVGDLETQLEFLIKELSEDYKSVLNILKNATSIKEASDVVLFKFERPADQSVAAQNKRASYGQKYYDKYAKKVAQEVNTVGKFKMRTTKPEAGNKYYITKSKGGWSNAIQGKPTDPDCNVLSNCVGYAYGRFNEIGGYGSCKYLSPVNAENFIQYKNTNLKVGQVPKLGACMVWQRGNTLSNSDGAGHVAIVEKVISDTEVYTSESGWNSRPFWNQTRKKGSGNWGQNASYKFLGFIYNPAVDNSTTVVDDVVVPIKPVVDNKINTIKEVQQWLNRSYSAGLVVDGKYGPKTKAALIRVLQKAIGVTVDGKYGPKTSVAVIRNTLRKGSTGEAVKALQGLLVCNGCADVYVDGKYGPATYNAVKAYEDKKGLAVSGVAGMIVFGSLCR